MYGFFSARAANAGEPIDAYEDIEGKVVQCTTIFPTQYRPDTWGDLELVGRLRRRLHRVSDPAIPKGKKSA